MTSSTARVLVVALLLVATAALPAQAGTRSDAVSSAKKRCKSSQVKQTVSYVKRAGGKTFKAVACVPRAGVPNATFGSGLRQSRKSALKLVPTAVRKRAATKAARRV